MSSGQRIGERALYISLGGCGFILRNIPRILFLIAALVAAIETAFWLKTGLWSPTATGLALRELGIPLSGTGWVGLEAILKGVAHTPLFVTLFFVGWASLIGVRALREHF